MEVVDSKNVKISWWKVAEFPLCVLLISTAFFSFAYFFLSTLFQVVLYINTILVIISLVYAILFGLIPLFMKSRDPPNYNLSGEFVSIIIPVFNDGEMLNRNLQNLLKLSYPNYEILIVYSTKSSDNTEEIALKYVNEYKNIRAIPENISKGNALNIGTENAQGEFILILDSDSFIHDGFIERIISHFANEDVKSATSAGGLGLNATQNIVTIVQWAMINNMNFYSAGAGKFLSDVGWGGFCGMWRRSALLECGGFATNTSSEEYEIAYRVNKMFPKWKGICDDQLLCYQYYTPDARTLYLQQLRWTKSNWKYSLKAFRSLFSMSFGRKFLSISTLLMVIIFPMFGLFTMGMSIVQFFANFFVPNLSFGGGLFFYLISQVGIFLAFTTFLIFVYPKYRGKSAVRLSRKFILFGVFLIMFVCGFIFGIVALNALKELITQRGQKDVFVKVDKTNLIFE